MKKAVIIIVLFAALFIFLINEGIIDQDRVNDLITGLTTEDLEAKETAIITEISPEPDLAFCPQDDCQQILLDFLEQAQQSTHCAFFDLDLEDVILLLKEKSETIDVKLVVDNENWKEIEPYNLTFAIKDTSSQLSHNKFCIIDNKSVFTGSMNPTFNGVTKNNNNLITIQSKSLAQNYENEFNELWNKQFGKGELTKNPATILNNKTKIQSFFCPEDWCANKVIFAIDKAETSIHFMTFSFTHDQIGKKIIEKHNAGIEVKGIFEKTQAGSQYSQFQTLKNAGMDVIKDSNPAMMHHKVFIIDNKTVITGSFNPTRSGDEKNDENLLIIEDEEIAGLFLREFERLFSS